MLISCKCLNFIATSPQLLRSSSVGGGGNNSNPNPVNVVGGANAGEASLAALLQVFLQRYPRNFQFYTQCMDFFKHAYGPIPDLTINAINQRDLIYSLTLDAAAQCWQLSFCINCKVVLCAKHLTGDVGTPTHYLINCTLLTSSEELSQRRSDKSYSETFELLIMDHAQLDAAAMPHSASNLSIGSLSSNAPLDGRQQRLRQLQAHQQARLQREIAETNERIERYTEQQFALLKSFRERCDQECALLVRLIQQVPEQASELLDRAMPTALEVTGGSIAYATGPGAAAAARRRNTISSRRELNGGMSGGMTSVPSTPTTPRELQQPPSFLPLPLPQPQEASQVPASSILLTSRKMSNFDTPPATPEATPMSVGNSPTFRQQQAAPASSNAQLGSSTAAGSSADDADDCLFDLEDVDAPAPLPSVPTLSFARAQIYQQQQQQHQLQFQRLQQQQQQLLHDMSDVDEGDAAEEAEDALDLDSSMPIPMQKLGARATQAQILNFAKSLPIEIANSPLAERALNNHFILEDEEVLDNTVDIAASIKALAKSVHGEAVFGDLPRPRLRSQI